MKKLFFSLKFKLNRIPNDGMAIAIVTMISLMMTLSTVSIYYLTSGFSESTIISSFKKQTNYFAESAADQALIYLNEKTSLEGHINVINDNDVIDQEDYTDNINALKCLGLMGYDNSEHRYIYNVDYSGPDTFPEDTDTEDYESYYLVQKITQSTPVIPISQNANMRDNMLFQKMDNTNAYGQTILETAFSLEINAWIDQSTMRGKTLFRMGTVSEIGLTTLRLYFNRNGDLVVQTQDANSGKIVNSPLSFNFDEDYPSHIVVTYNDLDNLMKVFVNKQLALGYTDMVLGSSSSKYDFKIGQFDGYLTMIRLWNDELTSDEVDALRNDYVTNSNVNADLLLAFHFDKNNLNAQYNALFYENKVDHDAGICNGRNRCNFKTPSNLEVEDKVSYFSLSSSDNNRDELKIYPSSIPDASVFKILSCGVGPNDTISGIERLVKYDGFNSINQTILGERKL